MSGHSLDPLWGARWRTGRKYVLLSWYTMMAFGGFGFGLLVDRQPFGANILVHPLVVFFALVGLVLLALRVLLARPVPNVISDRALIAGCLVGLAMFLVGNFVMVHWLSNFF